MTLDKLIIQLQRLGYRTQTTGNEIVLELDGRSRVSGSKAQIERLLTSFKKDAKNTARISTWSLSDHPEHRPQAQGMSTETRSSVSAQPIDRRPLRDNEAKPSYQKLLARLKRPEAERDAFTGYKVAAKDKKRKRRKKEDRGSKVGSGQRLIVSGGLPSLGKRR